MDGAADEPGLRRVKRADIPHSAGAWPLEKQSRHPSRCPDWCLRLRCQSQQQVVPQQHTSEQHAPVQVQALFVIPDSLRGVATALRFNISALVVRVQSDRLQQLPDSDPGRFPAMVPPPSRAPSSNGSLPAMNVARPAARVAQVRSGKARNAAHATPHVERSSWVL